MLDMRRFEKKKENDTKDSDSHNNMLIKAYQQACNSYHAAYDRYDYLLRIYTRLQNETAEREAYEGPSATPSYGEVILKQMISEASREKSEIAIQAAEYIKHLRSSQYAM